MSWEDLERRWEEFKHWFARDWGVFSDEELDALTGDRSGLIDAVAEKYDMPPKEAAHEVDTWLKRIRQSGGL